MLRATSRIVRGEASRRIAVVACGILLLTAVWLQRTTILAAGGELRSMPLWVVATVFSCNVPPAAKPGQFSLVTESPG